MAATRRATKAEHDAVLDVFGDLLDRKARTRDPLLYRLVDWSANALVAVMREHVIPRIPVPARIVMVATVAAPMAGQLLHRTAVTAWPAALLVGWVATFACWWRLRPEGSLLLPYPMPLSWRRWRIQHLDLLPLRWLTPLAIVLATLWLATVWVVGIRPILLDAELAAGLVAMIAAFVAGRRREPKRSESGAAVIVAAWDQLTAPGTPLSKSLGGSRAREQHIDGDKLGWTLAVDLAQGHVHDEIPTRNTESAFSRVLSEAGAGQVRRGALRITPDAEMAHRCFLRVVTKDLLTREVRWKRPTGERPSVIDAMRLGIFEEGDPALIRLVPAPGKGVSAGLAGMPDAGKSGVERVMIAHWAWCRDVVLAGIDPEETLGLWGEGVFEPGYLALDAGPAAALVLRRLVAIQAARKAWMRERGMTIWMPAPETPEVVGIIDEAADLKAYMELIDVLVRKGRKAGVHIVLATQRPTVKALGDFGAEVMAKVGAKLCMQVADPVEANIVLGSGSSGEGWRAHEMLTRTGEFLIRHRPDHVRPRRARADWMHDEDVERWAKVCAQGQTRLDAISAAAGESVGEVQPVIDDEDDADAA